MQSVMDDGDVAMAAHFSYKTAVPTPTHYLKITAVLARTSTAVRRSTHNNGRLPTNFHPNLNGRLSTNILLKNPGRSRKKQHAQNTTTQRASTQQ
jgi:hypothetical protein